MEFLTFHVGEREFAVDLARVREIVTPPPITRVPGMPPALLGLVGLRGDPIAVVDAGLRLAGRPVARSARTPLIVLSVQQADRAVEIGLLVEAAGRKLELEALLPWTDGLARFAGSDACTGFADVEHALVLVLDVDLLLSFGRIAAAGVNALPEGRSTRSRAAPDAAASLRGEGPGLAVEGTPPQIRQTPAAAPPPPPPPPSPATRAGGAAAPPERATRTPRAAAIAPERQPVRAPPSPSTPAVSAVFASPPERPVPPLPSRWSAPEASPMYASYGAPLPNAPGLAPEDPGMEVVPRGGDKRRLAWIAATALALAVIAAILLTADGGREDRATASRSARASTDSERRLRDAQPTAYAPSAIVASQAVRPPRTPPPEPAPPPAPVEPPVSSPQIALSPHPLAPTAPPSPLAVSAPPAAASAAPTPAAAPARPARKLPEFMMVTPETPACEIHEVRRGDTLWAISARRLGDPFRWPQVFGENRDHLVDPNVIEIDDRIRIPGACQPPGVR